jgi:hypothetical protein
MSNLRTSKNKINKSQSENTIWLGLWKLETGSLANSASPAEVARAKSNQQNPICLWWLWRYMRGWRMIGGVLGSCSNPRTRPYWANLIHSPRGQDMVTQHRDRFCAPHCFDVCRGLKWNLDVIPVPLESLSS